MSARSTRCSHGSRTMAERRVPFRRGAGYFVQAALLAGFLGSRRMLPVDWASGLGGWIGRRVGPLLAQTRKATRNLARAFPENSPEQNRRIVLGMWDNLGRVVAEYPHLPRICDRLEGGRVEIVGFENYLALESDGKPGILFGAHLANWEVLPFSRGTRGLRSASSTVRRTTGGSTGCSAGCATRRSCSARARKAPARFIGCCAKAATWRC